jgi:hypothetical protein
MTVFAQKDYYLNHLRNEHWNQQEVKNYSLKLDDQKFNTKFSIPITENLTKRPRVNIISEQDIIKTEQELHQRIVFTSNIIKPGDKSASAKGFEIQLPSAETKEEIANTVTLKTLPTPRKRVRNRKRKPILIKKQDQPVSEEETTRASATKATDDVTQQQGVHKKLKIRSLAQEANSTPISPVIIKNVNFILAKFLLKF